MSNYSQKVTLTENGHVLIPKVLRDNLGWSLGDTITISLNTDGNLLTLESYTGQQGNENMRGVIDNWGRLTLPKEIKECLGWGAADILILLQAIEGKKAFLKRFQQYESKCVICKTSEVIAKINNSGACKQCVETLRKSLAV